MATITSATQNSSQQQQNMYRVGDYVYFENSASSPFAIRRIDELNRTANGNVEARVVCFYRRSEVSSSVLQQAEKNHWGSDVHADKNNDDPDSDDDDSVNEEKSEKAQLKQREVFLSRQTENLPATLIRGKCSVTLLSEVENAQSYLSRDDAFFYALVYDPHAKTLVADRGEIRIGSTYQASIPSVIGDKDDDGRGDGEKDENGLLIPELEERLWVPHGKNKLADMDTDKFLIIARSVGTFARALDCSSSVKQPSLHMSAAAASRDVTLFHAHQLLHKHNYDIADALKMLVPTTGPMLCRDEMEDWSASEANLFEEAIEKYGKDFNDIRKDFLPWKSMKNIIEYFFMWKTTDRYVQQKRIKALEAESKLKQVFVPNYTNKSTRLNGSNGEIIIRGKDCDAYPNLPKYSWAQYKKYSKFIPATLSDDSFIIDKTSLSTAARLAQLRPGLIIEPGSPAPLMPTMPGKPGSGKTRAAFYLRTTPLLRAARRVCTGVKLRHHARKPGKVVDIKALKVDAASKMTGYSESRVRTLNTFNVRTRVTMGVVVKRLGQKDDDEQEWLILTPKEKIPKPEKEFYPRPPKRPDGSYIYDRIPPSAAAVSAAAIVTTQPAQLLYKKRAYEERPATTEGLPAMKMQRLDGRTNIVPPKGRVATLTRIQGGQRQVISWMDAPDDVYYKATAVTKKLRKRLPVVQLRRAARKPFKKVISLPPLPGETRVGVANAMPTPPTAAATVTPVATVV